MSRQAQWHRDGQTLPIQDSVSEGSNGLNRQSMRAKLTCHLGVAPFRASEVHAFERMD